MQADILVVDDESEIADLVDVYLRSWLPSRSRIWHCWT